MIDTHCHLLMLEQYEPIKPVLDEAIDAGMQALVHISTEPKEWVPVESFPSREDIRNLPIKILHTIGLHPHEAKVWAEDTYQLMRKHGSHPNCVAIGELGLDFHYNLSPKDEQFSSLTAQLEIARELKKPIVVHSREGEAELLPYLESHAKQCSFEPGIIHCFTGTADFARSCLNMGYVLSFSGIITFKNAQDLRDIAKATPLDRFLIETDAPFLAPVPYRGKKCHPAWVKNTAQLIADLHSQDEAAFIRRMDENANRVFQGKLY